MSSPCRAPVKELHWSLQDLQKLHFVSKEAEAIFPEFFMVVKTRFPRESVFATKYMPGFQRILLWNHKCCISVHWVLLKIWSRMKGCRRLCTQEYLVQARTSCRVHFPGELISECVNFANCGHPQNFQFFLLSIRRFLSDLWSTSTGRQPVTSTAWRKNTQEVTNRNPSETAQELQGWKLDLHYAPHDILLATNTYRSDIFFITKLWLKRTERWGEGKEERSQLAGAEASWKETGYLSCRLLRKRTLQKYFL